MFRQYLSHTHYFIPIDTAHNYSSLGFPTKIYSFSVFSSLIVQRLEVSMSHTSLSLLRILILYRRPFRMGYNRGTNISTKHSCFVIARAIHTTKLAWKMSHSFGPLQFQTRKILYPWYISLVACTVTKVIRHTTSDSDVCEVDLHMLMSFLNAAPYHIRVWLENLSKSEKDHYVPVKRSKWKQENTWIIFSAITIIWPPLHFVDESNNIFKCH